MELEITKIGVESVAVWCYIERTFANVSPNRIKSVRLPNSLILDVDRINWSGAVDNRITMFPCRCAGNQEMRHISLEFYRTENGALTSLTFCPRPVSGTSLFFRLCVMLWFRL